MFAGQAIFGAEITPRYVEGGVVCLSGYSRLNACSCGCELEFWERAL